MNKAGRFNGSIHSIDDRRQRVDHALPAKQFRHALATQMLRHGASLTEIGEALSRADGLFEKGRPTH